MKRFHYYWFGDYQRFFIALQAKKPAVQKDSRFLVLSYVLLKQAKRVAVGKDYVFLQILFLVVYVVYAPAAAQCFV